MPERCHRGHAFIAQQLVDWAQTGLAAVPHANLDLAGFVATNRMTGPSPKRSHTLRPADPRRSYRSGGFRTFSARANSTLPDHGSGHSAGSRRGTPGDLQGCQLAKVRCGCSFVLQQGGKGQTKKNQAVLRLVSFLSHLRRINGSGLSGDGHRVIDRRAVWAKKGL